MDNTPIVSPSSPAPAPARTKRQPRREECEWCGRRVRMSRIVDALQLNCLPARICPQCAADEEQMQERDDYEPECSATVAFDELYGGAEATL